MIDQPNQPQPAAGDALHTLAVNSAYDASRSLSKWLKQGVRLTTDGFVWMPLTQVGRDIDSDEPWVIVHVPITGELNGHAILAMSLETARTLIEALTHGRPDDIDNLDEAARSCLEETGNIVCNAFANSWARWLEVMSLPGPPTLHIELLPAVLQMLLVEQAMAGDEVCMARTIFTLAGEPLAFEYCFLPAPGSLERIRQALA